MQTQENRHKHPPVPNNFNDYLTPDQKMVLIHLNRFGWELKFIRRTFFEEPVVVVSRSDITFSILERDGRLHDLSPMKMRATSLAMSKTMA